MKLIEKNKDGVNRCLALSQQERNSPCKCVNHQCCLQGTLNSSELIKGKVQGKRCGRPGQTGRLGSRGHCGRSQPEKIPPDPHLGPGSGVIAWKTHKCPPWTGRTADWEARSSNLEELNMRCGVRGIRASSAHNWQ